MNRHVTAIFGRLSLRQPQRTSLEILDPPLKSDIDLNNALVTIQSEYSTVTDFERDFPSLRFALATGVGKTRLVGAFITSLHLDRDIRSSFFLLQKTFYSWSNSRTYDD